MGWGLQYTLQMHTHRHTSALHINTLILWIMWILLCSFSPIARKCKQGEQHAELGHTELLPVFENEIAYYELVIFRWLSTMAKLLLFKIWMTHILPNIFFGEKSYKNKSDFYYPVGVLINDLIDFIPPPHLQKIEGVRSIFWPLGKLTFKFRCLCGSYKAVSVHSWLVHSSQVHEACKVKSKSPSQQCLPL